MIRVPVAGAFKSRMREETKDKGKSKERKKRTLKILPSPAIFCFIV